MINDVFVRFECFSGFCPLLRLFKKINIDNEVCRRMHEKEIKTCTLAPKILKLDCVRNGIVYSGNYFHCLL